MNKRDISIEIYNAKPLSFVLNNESDFEGDLNPDNTNLELNSKIKIDNENSTIIIEIDLNVVLKTNEESLFRIKSLFEYGVSNLTDVLLEGEKGYILELGFSRKLLNISIGGTRGMLSVYLQPTQHKGFTLPIANIPDSFFPKEKKNIQ